MYKYKEIKKRGRPIRIYYMDTGTWFFPVGVSTMTITGFQWIHLGFLCFGFGFKLPIKRAI